ncbi:MAG: 30S ribosomal protein S12 methylthiotransferase RimO [Actinomycetes bacterium]
MSTPLRVALVTLGCARNEVDSEEMAARLAAEGWELVDEASDADAVVVNTCGFVDAAKKDSIDTVLAAAQERDSNGSGAMVVAVGCLAERYGDQLAAELPEANAVLGFDDYPDIAARLRSIVEGTPHVPHAPRDRRLLLPVSPAQRQQGFAADAPSVPGMPGLAGGPRVLRRRLDSSPVAPLKLASGCDRRCAFCAIPSFRGSFVSREALDVIAEAQWLASEGVRELVLVSENSTSYGKDLGDIRLLEALIPRLAEVDGISRVRVSYLQPAEMRGTLIRAITTTEGVADYFDLSFQHSSATVLRRMRRFGGTKDFLALLEGIRAASPSAGVRSNVIVGFPGETQDDLDELAEFLTAARLDAVGVFGYSDEDGTEAATLDDHLDAAEIRSRVEFITSLVDELSAQRAEDRIGETVEVLVESLDGATLEGRAAHQGPEVDGSTTVTGFLGTAVPGDIVSATVVGTDGIDLIAEATSQ